MAETNTEFEMRFRDPHTHVGKKKIKRIQTLSMNKK